MATCQKTKEWMLPNYRRSPIKKHPTRNGDNFTRKHRYPLFWKSYRVSGTWRKKWASISFNQQSLELFRRMKSIRNWHLTKSCHCKAMARMKWRSLSILSNRNKEPPRNLINLFLRHSFLNWWKLRHLKFPLTSVVYRWQLVQPSGHLAGVPYATSLCLQEPTCKSFQGYCQERETTRVFQGNFLCFFCLLLGLLVCWRPTSAILGYSSSNSFLSRANSISYFR